jgi:hypothetical protein
MPPTESLTIFRDGISELVTIYCKYDGYPSGYGRDLAEMVAASAADIGTLAVQVISRLNRELGGVRVLPCGSSVGWQGYLYTVSYNIGRELFLHIEHGGTILFDGTTDDCLTFCSNHA